MQATQPISTGISHLKAALAAVVIAALVVAAIVAATLVGPAVAPTDAGSNVAPLTLDSDARAMPGNRGSLVHQAQ